MAERLSWNAQCLCAALYSALLKQRRRRNGGTSSGLHSVWLIISAKWQVYKDTKRWRVFIDVSDRWKTQSNSPIDMLRGSERDVTYTTKQQNVSRNFKSIGELIPTACPGLLERLAVLLEIDLWIIYYNVLVVDMSNHQSACSWSVTRLNFGRCDNRNKAVSQTLKANWRKNWYITVQFKSTFVSWPQEVSLVIIFPTK